MANPTQLYHASPTPKAREWRDYSLLLQYVRDSAAGNPSHYLHAKKTTKNPTPCYSDWDFLHNDNGVTIGEVMREARKRLRVDEATGSVRIQKSGTYVDARRYMEEAPFAIVIGMVAKFERAYSGYMDVLMNYQRAWWSRRK